MLLHTFRLLKERFHGPSEKLYLIGEIRKIKPRGKARKGLHSKLMQNIADSGQSKSFPLVPNAFGLAICRDGRLGMCGRVFGMSALGPPTCHAPGPL